jgi:putative ATP-binding cassette transporter
MTAHDHPQAPAAPLNAEAGTGLATTIAEALRLLKPVWPLAALATGLGLASGAAAVALLARVNEALAAEANGTIAAFVALTGLAALTLATGFASELGNTLVGQRVVASLRRDLCRRIVAAPLAQVEQVTSHRLMAVLTGDIEALSAATLNIAPVAVAAATVAGGLGYLAWQSPTLFPIVAIALVAGTIANARLRQASMRRLDGLRDAQEDLFGGFRAIVDGGKEVRMNRARRAALDTRLDGTIERIAGLNVRMRCLFGVAETSATGLFFAVVIVLVMLAERGSAAATASFLLLFLYLRAPLEQLVGAIPMLSRAQVALTRATALAQCLAPESPAEDCDAGAPAPAAFARIGLHGVAYAYPTPDGGRGFEAGPLDLTLAPGEIVFITGENGAGKSTMLKLLTGLYAPRQGSVSVDGVAVPADGRDRYRQLFSTVFFDFHLFDDLVLPAGTDQGDVDRWLTRLQLAGKVSVRDGRLSTTRLSAGQRRRLALLQVFLERRPVVALDEWAAEQDPAFRRIFYTELLPELRRRGTTVVAVTHDDRYFHIADRCVEVGADGRLSELRRQAA